MTLKTGKYKLPKWKTSSYGRLQENAVEAGKDNDMLIYVGRAEHDGDVIPGKVIPEHNAMYISYGGQEISKPDYQVLTKAKSCSLTWVGSSVGAVPVGALQSGYTSSGEPLFTARTEINGNCTIGKLHPSHGVAYFPYGGEEIARPEYEVLCCETCVLKEENEDSDDDD